MENYILERFKIAWDGRIKRLLEYRVCDSKETAVALANKIIEFSKDWKSKELIKDSLWKLSQKVDIIDIEDEEFISIFPMTVITLKDLKL